MDPANGSGEADLGGRLKELLVEARRRRVFRSAGVYLVGVWAISQGLVELAPLFGAPEWLLRFVLIGAVALAPFVVVLAWMFDIGREGLVRDPRDVERAESKLSATHELSQMPTLLGTDAAKGAVIVRWGDEAGDHSVAFVEDFFIGRASDCRVRFYDPLVSRKHARIFHRDGRWRIEDLGSRNGTLVDAKTIDAVALGSENEIRVNEAGPMLRLEVIEPGRDTMTTLAGFSAGASVAHVRSNGSDLGTGWAASASRTAES